MRRVSLEVCGVVVGRLACAGLKSSKRRVEDAAPSTLCLHGTLSGLILQ